MGQKTAFNQTNTIAGAGRRRFTRYFPRLFAYLQAMTGDETAAREAAASAFEATLREPPSDENEFTLSLFTAGREISRAQAAGHGELSSTENEVVSLTFDAQLTRSQVAELLGVEEDAVMAALLSGLHKLRDGVGPATGTRAVHGALPA